MPAVNLGEPEPTWAVYAAWPGTPLPADATTPLVNYLLFGRVLHDPGDMPYEPDGETGSLLTGAPPRAAASRPISFCWADGPRFPAGRGRIVVVIEGDHGRTGYPNVIVGEHDRDSTAADAETDDDGNWAYRWHRARVAA